MREATASGDDPTYVRTSSALARGRLLVSAEDQMAHPCRRRLEVLHIDQIGTHLKAYTFDDGDAFRLKLAPLLGVVGDEPHAREVHRAKDGCCGGGGTPARRREAEGEIRIDISMPAS